MNKDFRFILGMVVLGCASWIARKVSPAFDAFVYDYGAAIVTFSIALLICGVFHLFTETPGEWRERQKADLRVKSDIREEMQQEADAEFDRQIAEVRS